MENLKLFLETSTIHGLFHVSNTRKHMRLFWIIVVIACFTGAGVMIYQSFESWSDSPVKTTIETRPIEDITFPNITICPPKDTYTDLNYDLKMIENKTFNESTKKNLQEYAIRLINKYSYEEALTNLMKGLQEKKRKFNCYNGYSKINLPYIEIMMGWGKEHMVVNHHISTFATSGTILAPQKSHFYAPVMFLHLVQLQAIQMFL